MVKKEPSKNHARMKRKRRRYYRATLTKRLTVIKAYARYAPHG